MQGEASVSVAPTHYLLNSACMQAQASKLPAGRAAGCRRAHLAAAFKHSHGQQLVVSVALRLRQDLQPGRWRRSIADACVS